jgi:hypothetical protein
VIGARPEQCGREPDRSRDDRHPAIATEPGK